MDGKLTYSKLFNVICKKINLEYTGSESIGTYYKQIYSIMQLVQYQIYIT